MKSPFQRRRTLAALLPVVMLAFLAATARDARVAHGDAPAPSTDAASLRAVHRAVEAGLTAAPLVAPGAEQAGVAHDPCLHCHVIGKNTRIPTETTRWALALAAAAAFGLGMVRSATVWRTRGPWVPLHVRAARWFDERYRVSDELSHALSKPVPRFAMTWWYCLGGITSFLFFVQCVTGIMLAFYYKPTVEEARASIQFIQEQVRFGASIRLIHHWAANGMIVMAVAHMARTYIAGAYKRPRELNWISGALLLVLTLGFGFTGYLLPWDQRAYWATTVGSEIGGSLPVIGDMALVLLRVGWDVSGATLSRFYAAHVIVLPVVTIAAMGAHFLMIRRLGIHRPL